MYTTLRVQRNIAQKICVIFTAIFNDCHHDSVVLAYHSHLSLIKILFCKSWINPHFPFTSQSTFTICKRKTNLGETFFSKIHVLSRFKGQKNRFFIFSYQKHDHLIKINILSKKKFFKGKKFGEAFLDRKCGVTGVKSASLYTAKKL